MRKFVILLLGLVLIAAALFAAIKFLHHRGTPPPTITTTTTGQNATATTTSLQTVTSGYSGPILFGALATPLSYGGGSAPFGNNRTAVSAELSMLYDANASAIRMDISYDPWLQNETPIISTYDYFVNDVRAHGKKLVIADAAAESYRSNKLSWSDFKVAWVQRVRTLAARYHPDYYIVVKEPPWYFPMIQGSPLIVPFNASDWANLTVQLANAVKQVSPNTVVGVAVDSGVYHQKRGPLDLLYLQAVESIRNVSFIGFDEYGPCGCNDTRRFLTQVGRGDKQVWIAEAWSSAVPQYNTSYESSDVKWMNTLYSFARANNITAIIPFYTDFFASYSQRPSTAAQLIAYYQGRTPVFHAYRNITSGK